MNNERLILTVIILAIIFSLTSCYDSREIEEMAYVLAIGVDEGVNNRFRITIQFPTLKSGPSAGGGSGGSSDNSVSSEQNGYSTITFDASSIAAGIDVANTFVPRSLNFMHTKYVVISENLARKGITELLMSLVRYREIRKTAHVIIVKGSSEDFLKENKSTIGTTLSKTMELLMEGTYNTGYFPHTTLHDFHNSVHSTYEQAIAIKGAVNEFKNIKENSGINYKGYIKTGGEYTAGEIPRKGGSKVDLFGTAVFKWGKMVGELNGDETRILLMVRDQFDRGIFTIKEPKRHNNAISLNVQQEKPPEITISFEEGPPMIKLNIMLEGELLAVESMVNYNTYQIKPSIERAFEKYVREEMYKLFEKCKDLNVDIFGFGTVAAKHFNTIQEWERFKWLDRFKDAEINVNVEFYIRRTGNVI